MRHSGRRKIGFPLLILCGFVAMGATPTAAQRYQIDKLDQKYRNPRELKKIRSTTQDVMRGKKSLAAAKANVDEYYLSYFFPAMTSPDKLGKLAAMRNELTTDLGNCPNEEVHTYVRDMAYKQCRSRINSKYHPAVRYNCALLLGDLNQQVAGKSEAPVPYRVALRDLARLLNSKSLDDATLTAALIGIRRHAQLSGHKEARQSLYDDPKVQAYLVSKLGRFANTATPPAGRADSGHQWMRQIAVEGLGYLRTPGKSNAVVKLLMKVATQAESPIVLRVAAIEALARLDLEGSGVPGADLTETAGQVVYAACQAEYDAIDDQLKEATGGRGEGGRRTTYRTPQMPPRLPGREGGRPGTENERRPGNEFVANDPATMPFRRRLIHQLKAVKRTLLGDKRNGIAGIQSMEGADEKSAAIVAVINNMLEDAVDGDTDLVTFGTRIGSARKQVAQIIETTPPKPIKRDV